MSHLVAKTMMTILQVCEYAGNLAKAAKLAIGLKNKVVCDQWKANRMVQL